MMTVEPMEMFYALIVAVLIAGIIMLGAWLMDVLVDLDQEPK